MLGCVVGEFGARKELVPGGCVLLDEASQKLPNERLVTSV